MLLICIEIIIVTAKYCILYDTRHNIFIYTYTHVKNIL